MSDLEGLDPLVRLTDVSLVENPVSKRLLHRPHLVHRLTALETIDGIRITEEERLKAELYFVELQQVSSARSSGCESSLVLKQVSSARSRGYESFFY